MCMANSTTSTLLGSSGFASTTSYSQLASYVVQCHMHISDYSAIFGPSTCKQHYSPIKLCIWHYTTQLASCVKLYTSESTRIQQSARSSQLLLAIHISSYIRLDGRHVQQYRLRISTILRRSQQQYHLATASSSVILLHSAHKRLFVRPT